MVLICRNDAKRNAIRGISGMRYNELQRQRWEYAMPFCGCSYMRAR
ncbi:hypothetical protein [Prevotella pallens]|nr:hypothetical protein [Prevotella pallens]